MSGRKYRHWSKEEKHRIIRRLFDEEISVVVIFSSLHNSLTPIKFSLQY